MQKITSRENQKLKFARKVRDGRVDNAIFVEGLRLAEEALRSDLKVLECFFTENFAEDSRGNALLERVRESSENIAEIPGNIFNTLSDTKNSQGVILICEKPETGKNIVEKNLEKNLANFPFIILLHQINNPSNLGAILRTAEAVGAAGIILTKNSAEVFSPKSLRGAMGAAFRLNFWTNTDFKEVIGWAKEKNLFTICADVSAGKTLWEIDWQKPRLLIFGSEAHGLSVKERSLVDEGLIIPMENDVESLNLAVSCGIILYEAKRKLLLK